MSGALQPTAGPIPDLIRWIAIPYPDLFINIALIIGIGHDASALIAGAIGRKVPDRADRL